MTDQSTDDARARVLAPAPTGIERAAVRSWQLLTIGLAVAAAVWLTGQLLLVVVPLAVAALLTAPLSPLSSRLGGRAGARPWPPP